MTYKTAITHDHTLNRDGSLCEEGARRLDKSIELYKNGIVETLTMVGRSDIRDVYDIIRFTTHAKAMKEYAIARGIPRNRILIEETAGELSDTIGCIFYVKKNVIVPNNWNSLIMVSSDYHIPRIAKMTEFVFGQQYDIMYIGIDTSDLTGLTQYMKEQEAEKIITFQEFFKDVPVADDKLIEKRLVERHPYYNNSNMRWVL